MKSLLLRLPRIGTFILAFLLVASAWLPMFRPVGFPPIGLAGTMFPVFFVISILVLAIWLVMKRKEWKILLVAVLISLRGVLPYFAVGGLRGEVEAGDKSFTVMTFNSSSMGLVNYKSDSQVVKRIYATLDETSPDILCIQEFYTNTRPDLSHHLEKIAEKGKYPYQYFAPHYINWKTWFYGTVVFSRFPIIDTARIEFHGGFSRKEDLVRVRLRIHEDTTTLLVAHFASYQLDSDQYNIGRALLSSGGRGQTKQLIARQADIMNNEIDHAKHPVIVAGDFNDVPLSYTYRTVRGGRLQDAWLQRGFGIGRTFAAISPTLRIDYILPDQRFQVESVKVFPAKELQHFPVMARLSLRR